MKSLRQRIRLLMQRVIALSDLLKGLPVLDCPGDFDVTGEGLTKQWIAYELAVTLGLLEEAELTYYSIWPHENEWSKIQLQLAHRAADPLLPRLKNDILAEAMVRRDELVGLNYTSLGGDDLFGVLTVVHELINSNAVANFDSEITGVIVSHILLIGDAIKKLDADMHQDFGAMVKSYLSNLWIYPWIYNSDPDSLRYGYKVLFSLPRLNPQELTMNLFEGLSIKLRTIADNKEVHDMVRLALERLAGLIAQDGLDGLFDILSDNGSPFGGLAPNAKPLINVIPGTGDNQCRPILFAFAKSGSGKSRFSTTVIMRLVREHLIHCQNKVMVVILVAPLDGLSSSLEDSIGDIEAHMNNGKGPLKLFIPLAVFNSKMSMINWR